MSSRRKKAGKRLTHIDAISAIEAPMDSVPAIEMMKPYTTDAGPPLVYAPTKRALVDSHVHKVEVEKARMVKRPHSRWPKVNRRF